MMASTASRSLFRPGSFVPGKGQIQRGRNVSMVRSSGPSKPTEAPKTNDRQKIAYTHILLPILDANNYLSEGSKLALKTASQLAQGKVTVLVVDEDGTKSANPSTRLDSIAWHFRENGFAEYSILEKDISTPASVLIGDVADEVGADLVLLSTEAVHSKFVDANQLAEFVSCPLLLLP